MASVAVLSRYRSHRNHRLLNARPLRGSSIGSYAVAPTTYQPRHRDVSYHRYITDSSPSTISSHQSASTAPRFTYNLRSRVVSAGDTVKLMCTCSANPTARIQWFKDKYVIDSSLGRYSISSSQGVCYLEILKTNSDDTGIYQCVAENANGSGETSCQLFVTGSAASKSKTSGERELKRRRSIRFEDRESIRRKSSVQFHAADEDVMAKEEPSAPPRRRSSVRPPDLDKKLDDITVYENSVMQLKCSVTDRIPPTIKWYHNDELLRPDDRISIKYEDNMATCTIQGIRMDEAGIYKCVIKNDIDTITTDAEVTVKEAAEVDTENIDETAVAEHEIDEKSSESEVDSEPHQEVDEVSPSDITESVDVSAEEVDEGKLEKESPHAEDEEESRTAVVKFMKFLESKILSEGDDLVLSAEVEGDGELEPKWRRDGKDIPFNDDFVREKAGSKYSLKILDILSDDQGCFSVSFDDASLSAQSSCTIIIKEEGQKVADFNVEQFPKSQNCRVGDNVTLSCNVKTKVKVTGAWFLADKQLGDDDRHKISSDPAGKSFSLAISGAGKEDTGVYTLKLEKESAKKTVRLSCICDLHVHDS